MLLSLMLYITDFEGFVTTTNNLRKPEPHPNQHFQQNKIKILIHTITAVLEKLKEFQLDKDKMEIEML